MKRMASFEFPVKDVMEIEQPGINRPDLVRAMVTKNMVNIS
jgi:hypothetical protein